MSDQTKRPFNRFLSYLAIIIFIIAIITLIIGVEGCRYRLFKKKYGEHMTYFDLFMDDFFNGKSHGNR